MFGAVKVIIPPDSAIAKPEAINPASAAIAVLRAAAFAYVLVSDTVIGVPASLKVKSYVDGFPKLIVLVSIIEVSAVPAFGVESVDVAEVEVTVLRATGVKVVTLLFKVPENSTSELLFSVLTTKFPLITSALI